MARPTTLFRSASSFALLTGLFAAGASFPSVQVLAQDNPPAANAKKAPVTEQDVIVTATKRKQKAQDVALDLTGQRDLRRARLPRQQRNRPGFDIVFRSCGIGWQRRR